MSPKLVNEFIPAGRDKNYDHSHNYQDHLSNSPNIQATHKTIFLPPAYRLHISLWYNSKENNVDSDGGGLGLRLRSLA